MAGRSEKDCASKRVMNMQRTALFGYGSNLSSDMAEVFNESRSLLRPTR